MGSETTADRGEFSRFSDLSLMLMYEARVLAGQAGASQIEPRHFVVPCLTKLETCAPRLSDRSPQVLAAAAATVAAARGTKPSVQRDVEMRLSDSVAQAFERAQAEADAAGSAKVEPWHLLAAIADDPASEEVGRIMDGLGLSAAAIRAHAGPNT